MLVMVPCRVAAPSGQPARDDERAGGACLEHSGLLGIVERSTPSTSLLLDSDRAFGMDVDRLFGLECRLLGLVLRGMSVAME